MSTKIFCDIADKNQIKKFVKKKIVKGFTTNPSLMRSAGAKDYQKYSKEILKVCKKPISFEVFADDEKTMIFQGKQISKWANNVYVKVPYINSKGKLTPSILHFANEGEASWFEIAVEIEKITKDLGLLNKTILINPIASSEFKLAAKRPKYSVLDSRSSFESISLKNQQKKQLKVSIFNTFVEKNLIVKIKF